MIGSNLSLFEVYSRQRELFSHEIVDGQTKIGTRGDDDSVRIPDSLLCANGGQHSRGALVVMILTRMTLPHTSGTVANDALL
jgi:hypothetical protein